MWYILILPHWRVHVALCLEKEKNILWINNSIVFVCIINCACWLPRLRASVYDLGWALGFEPGFSFGMVMVAPVWYPLGYSINIFIGLKLVNSFVTWEFSLVGVSLGTLSCLMISIGEGYLAGLSLVLPLGSLLEYKNSGFVLGFFLNLWLEW